MQTKIKYMAKETYEEKTVILNDKQLCEFYQTKPYEQIISVNKV